MGGKINIGVVFEAELNDGGGFQTQISSLIQLNKQDKFFIKAFVFSKENKNSLELLNIESVLIKNSFFERYFRFLNKQEWFYKISRKFKLKTFFERELDTHNIDLVYFLSPSSLSLDLTTHNYIFTIWDLCHRDNPEFPEVNHFRNFENNKIGNYTSTSIIVLSYFISYCHKIVK